MNECVFHFAGKSDKGKLYKPKSKLAELASTFQSTKEVRRDDEKPERYEKPVSYTYICRDGQRQLTFTCPKSFPFVKFQLFLLDQHMCMLPIGEAYSRRFVRLFVRPVPCPGNSFKTVVGI